MFYRRIKFKYESGTYELNHVGASTSDLITRTRISMYISILTRQDRLCFYNALHKYFGKLILTGCCLVTQTVNVKCMDLDHGPIYYRINETLLVFFFVHRR